MLLRLITLQSPPPIADSVLPLSSLRLLVPPLRVMSAVMWKVVHQRNITHYGKVVEFVSLVAETIPGIFTNKQMGLLTLGLRAKVRDTGASSINTQLTLADIDFEWQY